MRGSWQPQILIAASCNQHPRPEHVQNNPCRRGIFRGALGANSRSFATIRQREIRFDAYLDPKITVSTAGKRLRFSASCAQQVQQAWEDDRCAPNVEQVGRMAVSGLVAGTV